jgi:hypothetical protein
MARLRVCAEPGCPELSSSRYCPTDAAKHEQARGTRQQRGYTSEHDRLRTRWKPKVDSGLVDCCNPICLMPIRRILPGEPWQLGHTPDRTAWRGPEHRLCNESEGGKAAHVR